MGGDHQAVSVLFRGFGMQFQTLMSVKRRGFVCLEDEGRAMKALNVVKDRRFELRRIDCNARDVQMLKNNVPPPMRMPEKQQSRRQQYREMGEMRWSWQRRVQFRNS